MKGRDCPTFFTDTSIGTTIPVAGYTLNRSGDGMAIFAPIVISGLVTTVTAVFGRLLADVGP